MESSAARRLTGNRLIDTLPDDVAEELSRSADLRTFAPGAVLAARGDPIDAVYFPVSGAIAHLEAHAGGKPVEVASIGNSGASAFEVLLGVPRAQFERLATVPLAAFAAAPRRLRPIYARSGAFQTLLLRYAVASIRVAGIAAACARHGHLEARLAGWLLQLCKSTDDAELRVTHELAARMLGAQRAGVTHAYGALVRAGAIRSERGRVRVADVRALASAACSCYAEAEAVVERVYAPGSASLT